MAFRSVRNSIRSTARFSAACFAFQRPVSGSSRANHALSDHASETITMYAQLLTRVSTGACSARTPPFSCASRFSWLQRSFASKTISAASQSVSFVR